MPITPDGPWRYADLRPDLARRRFLRRPRGPQRRRRGDQHDRGHPARWRRRRRSSSRAPTSSPRRACRRTARGSPGSSGTTRTCPGTRPGCGSPPFEPDGRSARPSWPPAAPRNRSSSPSGRPTARSTSISDRTGWWNLYRLVDGPAVGAARPDGGRVRRPGLDLRPLVATGSCPTARSWPSPAPDGRDHLYRIEPGPVIGEVEMPFTELEWLRVGCPRASSPSPAAPGDPSVIARFDPATLAPAGVLRRASTVTFDPAIIAEPESIEFPTTGGRTAHALFYRPTNPELPSAPTASGRRCIVLSHGGPTSNAYDRARPREAVPDQPRHRRRRRRLRRQHRLRPGIPPRARRAVGRRRRRRLRRRGAVPGRARRRRPGSAGHRGRQRGRLHDARRPRLPRRLRGRDQPVRDRRPGAARATDSHKFESRYTRPPGRAVSGGRRAATASARRVHFLDQISSPVLVLQGLDDQVVPAVPGRVDRRGPDAERRSRTRTSRSRAKATASAARSRSAGRSRRDSRSSARSSASSRPTGSSRSSHARAGRLEGSPVRDRASRSRDRATSTRPEGPPPAERVPRRSADPSWYARSDPCRLRAMSIVDAAHYLFTSESVTEGHPDKMCDQISDAILDAIIREDPNARVACETATTTGLVMVLGEITTTTYVDFQAIVRDTVRDIGYTRADYGFDYLTCGTLVSVKEQSPDIAQGVDSALEVRDDAALAVRARRRRPGDDVRLRLPRDARADAAADRPGPPDGPPPRRGPQVRPAAVPPPRRQDPGHGRVRARRPEAGPDRRRLGPARPGRPRRAAALGDRRGGHPADDPGRAARRPTRSCTSTRPAASSPAARWATPA